MNVRWFHRQNIMIGATGWFRRWCGPELYNLPCLLRLPLDLPFAGRSETDIANVVEQRIWRSMEEGHFENLPGKGKPLDLADNPHADPAEDTLYRILSRNGCAPEWIELNKEIRRSIGEWRLALRKALPRPPPGNDGDPLCFEHLQPLKSLMADINSKATPHLPNPAL